MGSLKCLDTLRLTVLKTWMIMMSQEGTLLGSPQHLFCKGCVVVGSQYSNIRMAPEEILIIAFHGNVSNVILQLRKCELGPGRDHLCNQLYNLRWVQRVACILPLMQPFFAQTHKER